MTFFVIFTIFSLKYIWSKISMGATIFFSFCLLFTWDILFYPIMLNLCVSVGSTSMDLFVYPFSHSLSFYYRSNLFLFKVIIDRCNCNGLFIGFVLVVWLFCRYFVSCFLSCFSFFLVCCLLVSDVLTLSCLCVCAHVHMCNHYRFPPL